MEDQELTGGKHLDSVASSDRKMSVIPGNEAHGLTGKGNLQKGLVACVRQRVGQRGRSYEGAAVLNVVQKSSYLVDPELELGTTENFIVFGQNACVETQ
jgi:hypothetical protein